MPTSVQILERLLKCMACYARALSLSLKVYTMEQVKKPWPLFTDWKSTLEGSQGPLTKFSPKRPRHRKTLSTQSHHTVMLWDTDTPRTGICSLESGALQMHPRAWHVVASRSAFVSEWTWINELLEVIVPSIISDKHCLLHFLRVFYPMEPRQHQSLLHIDLCSLLYS